MMIGTPLNTAPNRPRLPAMAVWVCTIAGRSRRSSRHNRHSAFRLLHGRTERDNSGTQHTRSPARAR
jgi:hypothetical protein